MCNHVLRQQFETQLEDWDRNEEMSSSLSALCEIWLRKIMHAVSNQ